MEECAIFYCFILFCRDRKVESRRIVLFTNFDHECSDDNIEGIINGFSAENMDVELNVMYGVCFGTFFFYNSAVSFNKVSSGFKIYQSDRKISEI